MQRVILALLFGGFGGCASTHPIDASTDASNPEPACVTGVPHPDECAWLDHQWSRVCAGSAPCVPIDATCAQYVGAANTCDELEAALSRCCEE